MLRKSRTRAIKALFGSAILLALPLATGCQTGNFGGNIPGYGAIAGWWGGADKPDPNKPPAGYQANLPSSRSDPNGQSYAGGAQGRGVRRGADVDYGAEGGGYDRSAPGGYGAQGPSYAAGNRNNLNNWGEKATRRASASTYGAETEGEFAGANSGGYGAAPRGQKASPGYDPYGGATPSANEEDYGAASRGSTYAASNRGAATGRASAYNTRMASGSQRATKSSELEDEGYETEQAAPSGGTSRFSSREEAAAPRSRRYAAAETEDDGAMTADDDLESTYPQTQGYGSGYKVPASRGAVPSTDRRYPGAKSSGASSRTTDDDYGMTGFEDESAIEKVAASEPTRYGLSSKAAAMLDRGIDGDFRPGSTSRPGYRTASKVSPVAYSSEDMEEESTATGRTASRFAE